MVAIRIDISLQSYMGASRYDQSYTKFPPKIFMSVPAQLYGVTTPKL